MVAHTTLEERAQMTPENRQVAWAYENADELAKIGAIKGYAPLDRCALLTGDWAACGCEARRVPWRASRQDWQTTHSTIARGSTDCAVWFPFFSKSNGDRAQCAIVFVVCGNYDNGALSRVRAESVGVSILCCFWHVFYLENALCALRWFLWTDVQIRRAGG